MRESTVAEVKSGIRNGIDPAVTNVVLAQPPLDILAEQLLRDCKPLPASLVMAYQRGHKNFQEKDRKCSM